MCFSKSILGNGICLDLTIHCAVFTFYLKKNSLSTIRFIIMTKLILSILNFFFLLKFYLICQVEIYSTKLRWKSNIHTINLRLKFSTIDLNLIILRLFEKTRCVRQLRKYVIWVNSNRNIIVVVCWKCSPFVCTS